MQIYQDATRVRNTKTSHSEVWNVIDAVGLTSRAVQGAGLGTVPTNNPPDETTTLPYPVRSYNQDEVAPGQWVCEIDRKSVV